MFRLGSRWTPAPEKGATLPVQGVLAWVISLFFRNWRLRALVSSAIAFAMESIVQEIFPRLSIKRAKIEAVQEELERRQYVRAAEQIRIDSDAKVEQLCKAVAELKLRLVEGELRYVEAARQTNIELNKLVDRLQRSSCYTGTIRTAEGRGLGAGPQPDPFARDCSCSCSADRLLRAVWRIGPALGFAQGMPTAATVLFRCCYHIPELQQDPRAAFAGLLNELVQADNLPPAAQSYWLSTAAWTAAILRHTARNTYPGCADHAVACLPAPFSRFVLPTMPSRMLGLAAALQSTVVTLMDRMRSRCMDQLTPLLDAFLEFPASGRGYRRAAQRHGVLGRRFNPTRSNALEQALGSVRSLCSSLEGAFAPPALVTLMRSQLDAMADAWLINKLLLRRDLCSRTHTGLLLSRIGSLTRTQPQLSLARTTQALRFLCGADDLVGKAEADIEARFDALSVPQLERLSHMAMHWSPSLRLPQRWERRPESVSFLAGMAPSPCGAQPACGCGGLAWVAPATGASPDLGGHWDALAALPVSACTALLQAGVEYCPVLWTGQ
mmetsp:Transcript_19276/g.45940  ORF Transcript_19276/g.45940 Transcript_19276/m.45940 type:complete len:553 (-) Transcript_19276:77-1735(-)